MPNEINFPSIDKIAVNIKEGAMKISFETRLPPGELARLLNFSKQGKPMTAVISSPQAALDLKFEEFEVNTGLITTVRF